MAQDGTAQWRTAAQHGQVTVIGKCPYPDDGVVAPVVSRVGLPEALAGRQHRTVETASELHQSTEEGGAAGRYRYRLDQAGAWIGFHGAHQFDHRRPAHDAVGIQYHHEIVVSTPALTEVRNVTGLTTEVRGAASIIHAGRTTELLEQGRPCGLLGPGDGRIGGVAQQVGVELVTVPGAGQRAQYGGQTAHDQRRVFVMDRHDQRGAAHDWSITVPRWRSSLEGQRVASERAQHEPDASVPERHGNPVEGRRKQHQNDNLQGGDPIGPYDVDHHADADQRGAGNQPEEQPAPQPH